MHKMPIKSHMLSAAIFLPTAIFACISAYYITYFHVWPLSRDQWHMYAPYFEHGLWQTALTPMSTHRHIFPFFLFAADMEFFGGRNHFLTFSGALFNCVITCLLLFCLVRETTLTRREKQCIAALTVTLQVWLLNIAQLGWGFMSAQYYLAILMFLASIYCAYQYQTRMSGKLHHLFACIVAGVICTFSFGMGILVWPTLLFFLWTWRSKLHFALILFISLIFCLGVFFVLPGGEQIEGALLFQPVESLRFIFQFTGGPIYYLLKSYRIIDLDICKTIATIIGVAATTAGIALLICKLKDRLVESIFFTLCYALIMVGIGTAALITFTRGSFFLDAWVDRYQIWATLFWLGLLSLAYQKLKNNFLNFRTTSRNVLLSIFCFLPIIALPSQLDMGGRLAEYTARVRHALLFYQVGIPHKEAAMDALHWNWQNKLPYFFTVLSHIKEQHKNIYYDGYYDHLGQPVTALLLNKKLLPFNIAIEKINTISPDEMLESNDIVPEINKSPAGMEIYANIPDNITWSQAVIANGSGTIIGFGVLTRRSHLPRGHFKYTGKDYDLYGITKNITSAKKPEENGMRYYLLDGADPDTVFVSNLN